MITVIAILKGISKQHLPLPNMTFYSFVLFLQLSFYARVKQAALPANPIYCHVAYVCDTGVLCW